MSEPKRPTVVPCPSCQRPVEWTPEAKWRPFCSERCKLIDLGAWMMEQRAIPGEEMRPSSEGEGLPGSPDDSVPRH